MKFFPIALAGLLLVAMPLRADEVTENLDRAREAYGKGNLASTAEELGFALAAVGKLRQQQYAALFPKPPSGWTLAEMQDDGGQGALAAQLMGGGVIVERDYTQENGEGRITAKLVVDSPLVQAMGSMVSNPAMMPPHTRRVRLGSDNAMVKQEPGSQEVELTLVKGNAMLQLEGEGIDKPELLVELARGFDLSKVQRR